MQREQGEDEKHPSGVTHAFAGVPPPRFLAFVTFFALIASEFSGGTFRSLLLR